MQQKSYTDSHTEIDQTHAKLIAAFTGVDGLAKNK